MSVCGMQGGAVQEGADLEKQHLSVNTNFPSLVQVSPGISIYCLSNGHKHTTLITSHSFAKIS